MSNYKKTEFFNGQILKAEHLNNIEDGIIANENAISNMASDIAAKQDIIAVQNAAIIDFLTHVAFIDEYGQQYLSALASALGVEYTPGSGGVTPPPQTPTTYTVTYNINGHGTQPARVTGVTKLPNPLPVLTETGFIFGGWYKNSGLTTTAVAGSTITSNTTLYAKWTEESTGGGGTPIEPPAGDVSNEETWTDGVVYTYTSINDCYVDSKNGNILEYNGWSRTPELYCKGASKIRITIITQSSMFAQSNGTYNAFYDSEGNFISSFAYGFTKDSEAGTTVDIEVPSNAEHFICSGSKATWCTDNLNDAPAYLTVMPIA